MEYHRGAESSRMKTTTPTWVQRLPFFYGWVLVVGQFLGGVAFAGALIWAFGLFAISMSDDLGWSQSTIFGALTVRALIAAAILPLYGRLMDRRKWPVVILVLSGTLFAASLMAVSLVQTELQFFLVLGVMGGIASAGAAGMMYQILIPKWFIRKRGRVMSIGTMGSSIAAMMYPPFVQGIIDAAGWRMAWVVIGLSVLVLTVPVSFLVRRSPEDLGLLPDGDSPPEGNRALEQSAEARQRPKAQVQEQSFTVHEAIRQRSTWLVVAATVIAGITSLGIATNWIPFMRDVGVSGSAAALVLTIYGLFAAVSRLVWGFLVDKYSIRSIMIAQGLLTFASIAFLTQVTSFGLAVPALIGQAFTVGGYVAIMGVIWANYFGRAHLGAIRGAFGPATAVATAVGPLIVAATFDISGSYLPAFWGLAISWLVVALLFSMAKPLVKQGHPVAEPQGAEPGRA
jgi:MFS family permease